MRYDHGMMLAKCIQALLYAIWISSVLSQQVIKAFHQVPDYFGTQRFVFWLQTIQI